MDPARPDIVRSDVLDQTVLTGGRWKSRSIGAAERLVQ